MAIPQLPPELWFRVFRFCPPEALSALSQVNKEFHKLATDNSHYEKYTSSDTPHTLVQAFRRKKALSHPPTFSEIPNPSLRFVYTARNTTLFLDLAKRCLVAFPHGHVFNLFENSRYSSFHVFRLLLSNIVPMFDEYVAIIMASSSSLKILNLQTGETFSSPLKVPLPQALSIAESRRVLLAGKRFIAYRAEDGLLTFVDWKTGLAPCPPKIVSSQTIFMFAEHSNCHEPTFVGTAIEAPCNHPRMKKLVLNPIFPYYHDLKISTYIFVKYILVSKDKRTLVLTVSRFSQSSHPTHFLAYRFRKGDNKFWHGELPVGMHQSELRENGNIIVTSRFAHRFRFLPNDVIRWPVCIILNETDDVLGNVETVFVKRTNRCPLPIWSHVTLHEIFVVMIGRAPNKIELVQIHREKEAFKETVLTSFVIDRLERATVVADHYILATDRSQKLHLAHFDRFCNGARGVYACPLISRLSPRFLPDGFRTIDNALSKETNANLARKRRTDNESDSNTAKRRRADGRM